MKTKWAWRNTRTWGRFWSPAHFSGIWNNVDTVCIQRVPKTELKHTHLGSKILKEISKDRKIERGRGRSKSRTIQYTVSWKPRAQNFKRERMIFIKWYRQLEIKDNGVQEAPEASRVLFILSHRPILIEKKKKKKKKSKENRKWIKDHLQLIFIYSLNPIFSKLFVVRHYYISQPNQQGQLLLTTEDAETSENSPESTRRSKKRGERVRVTLAFQVGSWGYGSNVNQHNQVGFYDTL